MKFIVDSYVAETTEDSYKNGELLNGSGTWWTNKDCPAEGYFDTISDALNAISKANYFDTTKWEWDDYNETFYTDVLVDVDNSEASKSEIEMWKKDKVRLWNCRLTATIKKQGEPVSLDEEDVKDFC